eukprot:2570089-Amphidinium_carterae.1
MGCGLALGGKEASVAFDAYVKALTTETVAEGTWAESHTLWIVSMKQSVETHNVSQAKGVPLSENTLKYVELAMCTFRVQELQLVKRDNFMKIGPQGQLSAVASGASPTADLSTDYRVRQAMQRRALAFDQFDTLDYDVMEAWHEYLFDHKPMSMQQVLDADRQIFMAAAQKLGSKGVSRQADGSQPLKGVFEARRADPLVSVLFHNGPSCDRGAH